MIWKRSLPARVALATTGLLALLMLLIIGAAYSVTAFLLREGLDRALLAALPAQASSIGELVREAERYEEEEHSDRDRRRIQVLDPNGVIQFGPQQLPVDRLALALAHRSGITYISVIADDGHWERRRGPDWWQTLTPREDELRVMYARAGREPDSPVVQVVAPLGMVGEVLPPLFRSLTVLGLIGIFLAGGIAWRMAAKTYRPLQAIIATASDISTRTPGIRIADHWADTTLKRLTAVLNAMISRLQEAFETQGRFVGAAAHELRGPLAAMRAELEVTLRRERSPAEYKTALQGALQETARLSALAEHLLTLARYERGSRLAMDRVDLAAIARRAADEVIRSEGSLVEVHSPPSLEVYADGLALERLVANLARNGVQAGGSPVVVRLSPEAQGVTLTVTDNGRGIPAGDLSHLFEPFYRADPARSRTGGTGLGLSIVKSIVEAHHGRIAVRSTPGEGTTVTVWLPRQQEWAEAAGRS